MKASKGLIIAVAAGVTVAGLVAFLTLTKNGKKLTKKWKVKGKKLVDEAGNYVKDAKNKFQNLKEEYMGA